jgi:hypothetical protein
VRFRKKVAWARAACFQPSVSEFPHDWIVDLDERTLEAFEAKAGAWVRPGASSDGDTRRMPPFEAIELDVGGPFTPLP